MTDSTEVRRTPGPFDDRTDPPMMADERTCLEAWLELYRTTVAIKLGALSAEQLCRAPVAPSNLTLLGLVRHLTEVEQYWFGTVAAGLTLPSVYCADDRDGDFTDLDPLTAFDDLARFDEEVVAARSRAGAVRDLDSELPGTRREQPVNLRWVYVHMIEEYARHLGHADLIRESIDGVAGY